MINTIKKVLQWSQRYTKADMLYIGKNSSWVMFGQTINILASLGLLVAFANLLPKETYGIYRYALSLIGILNIFTLTGMNTAVTQSVALGDTGILRSSTRYQLKWNLMMFFTGGALSFYYFLQGDHILSFLIFILAIFTPLTLALNTYMSFYGGIKKYKNASIFGSLTTLTYTIGMLVVLYFSNNPTLLVLVYSITTLVPATLFYVFTVRKYQLKLSRKTSDTFKYARELTYMKFIAPITSHIDKIILGSFWGAGHVATFVLASAIPQQIISMLKKWVAIGLPKFSTKTIDEINSVFNRRIFQGVFIGIIITLLYLLVSPLIFTHLLPQYVDGLIYSQILSFSFIVALPTRYIGVLFNSQKMSKQIFLCSIINSVVGISLYLIFGIYGGILGLVFASVLYQLIGLFVCIFIWKKYTYKLVSNSFKKVI